MIPESLSPLADHLWQSTVFAAIAALLTLALRNNRARARYWLWLAASVKFLIPLSLLVLLGSHIAWREAPASAMAGGFPYVMEKISRPFAAPVASLPKAPPVASPLPAILLTI